MKRQTIWKAALTAQTRQEVMMPRNASIMYAREQAGDICIWFKCDPSEPTIPRVISVFGTGYVFDGEHLGAYLGSAHLNGGDLVFHVFEGHN